MLIGAMNNPRRDVQAELQWMADMGLQFVDLTLEPPVPASWRVNPAEIRDALRRHRMDVIGHTAYYLPLASPFEEVRVGAVAELLRCVDVFGVVGAKWMNIHPDRIAPMHDRAFCIEQNLRSLHELLPRAQQRGVGLMIENLPGQFNNVGQIGELLDAMPQLGLHLDIGHCNLLSPYNTAEELIRTYGSRIRHVHLHDNNGGAADLHLPLGAGDIDVRRHVQMLKHVGYDATITLEVFSPDRTYLRHSCELLRRIWDGD